MTDERPMRILQVSASDRMGGAERIAATLCQGYRARGHESWIAVGQKTTDDRNVFPIDNDGRRHPWARLWRNAAASLAPLARVRGVKRVQLLLRDTVGQPRRTSRRNRGHEDFDFPASADFPALTPTPPDLLHLHNLHAPGGYFDLRQLPALSTLFPTVLTLHDAWLLSGHCAHSFDCDRWKTGCGSCPDLSIYPAVRRDATAFNWARKRDLFARCRLNVCTPSQWLMDKVSQSILQPAIVDARVIPNGVDLTIFNPGNQSAARHQLGLPQAARILLFAANGIRSNPFKDFKTLRAALQAVARSHASSELLFLALGEDAPDEILGPAATLRFVPFQNDEATIARYYQAADCYLHPARADTFPTSVLEAMACGKPVIASRIGGIPEQVTEGQTGHLTPVGDSAAMAAAICSLLDDSAKRQDLGRQAVAIAKTRFDVQDQIQTSLAYYGSLIYKTAIAQPAR